MKKSYAQESMKYFKTFGKSGLSFKDNSGVPSEFESALGKVAVWFAFLEGSIVGSIHVLLESDEDIGEMVTAELSFKNKVNLMGSLARKRIADGEFNFGVDVYEEFGDVDPENYLRELTACCFKAEELRNQIIHSTWGYGYERAEGAKRRKVTAKAGLGLRVHLEHVDAGYLVDIAHFFIYVMTRVEECFSLNEKDVD